MKSVLHDIFHGLMIARAHAEIIANEVEQADPRAAVSLRKLTKELWDVWDRYHPFLPTDQDIDLLRYRAKTESPDRTNKGNNTNT